MKRTLFLLAASALAVAGLNVLAQDAPVIPTPPKNQTNAVFTTATFSVVAIGTPPLSYQWSSYLAGGAFTNIAWGTNATLVVTNVTADRPYRVVVFNPWGSVTNYATNRVGLPASIAAEPADVQVEQGGACTFAVTGAGKAPLYYQWHFNSVALSGQTNNTLTLTNVQPSQAGAYRVGVSNNYCGTNLFGGVASREAQLVVFPTYNFSNITNGIVPNDPDVYFGAAWVDYDQDGNLDLFVAAGWPGTGVNRLYQGDGHGNFTKMTTNEVGSLVGLVGGWLGGSWADFNNDGFPDVYMISREANAVFLNMQGQRFEQAHGIGGLVDLPSTGAASWGDCNNDGQLDLLYSAINAGGSRGIRLFRNNGMGFLDEAVEPPWSVDRVTDAEWGTWSDLDNDGDMDVVVPDFRGTFTLVYSNNGDSTFTRLLQGDLPNSKGLQVAWGDYDNDGLLDLAMTAYSAASSNMLFHNEGGGTFRKIEFPYDGGQACAPAWGDLDNDGYLDLVVGYGQLDQRRTQVLRNNRDGTFTQLANTAPATISGQRGTVILGDYDNNGFLDLLCVSLQSAANNLLFHNEGNSNRWVTFKLEGTLANRSAIGAKVRVKTTVFGRTFWQLREISSGYIAVNDQRAHFGLGDATRAESVRIEWPSVRVTEMSGVTAGQILTIKEPTNDLPVIVTAPQPQTNRVGTTATLTVVAMGTPPLSYQWSRVGGADIVSATNDTLVLPNVTSDQRYQVLISNPWGSVTAQVTNRVGAPASIITQPDDVRVELGSTATISVGASGRTPLYYQWYHDGILIPGATANTLSITNVQLSEVGAYWVTVMNAYAGTNLVSGPTSRQAKLEVATGPRLDLVTDSVVVNDPGRYWGSAWVDYDQDGYPDLFVANGSIYSNTESNRLYHNNRDGTFTRMHPNEVGSLVGDPDGWMGCTWSDFNNDGWPDVYLTGARTNALYLNVAGQRFERIRDIRAMLAERSHGQSATCADYDQDGWVDLWVNDAYTSLGGARTRLFHNDGNGAPDEVLAPPFYTDRPFNVEFGAWGDMDNDGDADLVAPQSWGASSLVYSNNGDGTFTSVPGGDLATKTGLHVGWVDYDNDERLDLLITRYSVSQSNALFHNEGGGVFRMIELPNTGDQTGGAAWGDYDNDGDLDLILGRGQSSDQRNQFMQNNGDGTFTLLTNLAPVAFYGRSAFPNWGDYDNDGFLDLFIGHMNTLGNNVLFHNHGNSNHWIKFKLVGSVANRSAIGAKVRVQATIFGRGYRQMREISSGNGTMHDQRAHFGLGDATNAEVVRIEWPSGQITEMRNVAASQILTVTESPRMRVLSQGGTGLPNGAYEFELTSHPGMAWDLFIATNASCIMDCSRYGIGLLTGRKLEFGLWDSTNNCCLWGAIHDIGVPTNTWVFWKSVTNLTGTLTVTDTNAANLPFGFYKAVAKP